MQYNVLFLGIRLQPEINNINLPQLRWRFIVGYILFTPSFFCRISRCSIMRISN